MSVWAGGQQGGATAVSPEKAGTFRDGPDGILQYKNYTSLITLPLSAEKVTMKVMAATAGTPRADLNSYRNHQELEKRTNVHVEWVTVDRGEYPTFYRSIFAAGTDLPAIASVWSNNDVVDYYEGGLTLPLEELILEHAPDLKTILDLRPTSRKQMYHPDGHIPHLPMQYHDEMVLMGFMDKTWLEALNLPYPETLDDWEKTLHEFTYGDPNGNGIQDEYAWYVYHRNYLLIGNFGWLFGMSEIYSDFVYDDDGNVTYRWLMPQAKDCVQFVNKAYEEGWFPSLMIDDFDTFYPERGTWSKKPHAIGWGWTGDPGENRVGIIPPKNVPWTQYYQTYTQVYDGRSWVITKDAEDPALAIKWLDYVMAVPEGNLLMWHGFEGEHWYKKGDWYYRQHPNYHNMTQEEKDEFNAKRKEEIYSFGERPRIAPRDWGPRGIDPDVNPEGSARAMKLLDDMAWLIRPNFPKALPIGSEVEAFGIWGENGGNGVAWDWMWKFVGGKEPIENWDQMVAQLKKLGVEDYQAAGQSMYTRYLNF
jgi:putative aldouronate transport system substrate-binding protein